MSTHPPLLGLLPAAGKGTRLWPYRYPKELFPVALKPAEDGKGVNPWPVCHFSIAGMREAGVERCVVVVSDEKYEILRVLGDGSEVGLPLAYVHQRDPHGLPHVVTVARHWLRDADVVLALPDTVVLPLDAMKRLNDARRAQGMDVMLGVFPVDEPERLGPVELAADGAVIQIHDKPGHRKWMNAWALVSWNANFTRHCIAWDEERAKAGKAEGVLGHAMESARVAGMKVGAVQFPEGMFADIGTPTGLAATVRGLMERGLTLTGKA